MPGAGAVDTSGRSMGFVECQTSHFSTFAPMSKPPSKTVTGEEDGKKQEVFSPAILGVIICAGVFGLLLCILSAWIICCKGTGKEHVAALPGAYAKPISNSAPAFGDPRLEPPFRPAPSLLQPPSQPASARGDTRPPRSVRGRGVGTDQTLFIRLFVHASVLTRLYNTNTCARRLSLLLFLLQGRSGP